MRSLNKGNKKSFVIFGIAISFILGIFSVFIFGYFKNKSETYTISSGSVVYDKDENYIKLEEEGSINKLWNGEYSLEANDEKYTLGKQAVVYETNTGKLISYGNIYQVMEDASVVADDAATEISYTEDTSFYKLADRKYLVVGKEIEIPSQDLKTENYLLVNIDKGGTCKVFNDKLNLRILEEAEVQFGNYTFNIANEVLKTDEEEIALAKIGGSTNEYASITENSINKDKNEVANNDSSVLNDGTTNNTTINNNNNTNNVNNNQNNNLIGDLSQIIGNSIGNNSGQSGNNSSSGSTAKKESTLRINYITSGISELAVNYSILDYENKYSAVYLILEDNKGEKQNIILNKDENTRTIYGLQPDTQYSISIGATISKITDKGEQNEEVIVDTVKTRTSELDIKLTVEKFASDRIEFKLKVNNNITLDSGKVVLYADGEKIGEKEIDGEALTTVKGFNETFALENIENVKEFTIKVEDTVYNDQPIEVKSEITIQNSFIGNTIRNIKEIFYKLIKGEY